MISPPIFAEQTTDKDKRYLIDIFVPSHSRGLMVDALVLQRMLGKNNVRILSIPIQAYGDPSREKEKNLDFEPNAEIALFIERVFEHELLRHYSKCVFLPNPEWLTEKDKKAANRIVNEFWHKTRFGMNLLLKIFPDKKHKYTGFTSLNTPSEARDYSKFAHFPGKSKTRHTQDVIDIWLNDSTLPTLTFQTYGEGTKIPRWINFGNLKFFIGFLEDEALHSEFKENGVHICTSQMEGFGHYINEARSIGALIITLDAPPMNELIDSSCGILVPVEKALIHNHGLRFIATQKAIANGISQAINMPISERKKLGTNARNRFIKEQLEFHSQLNSIVFETKK